MVHYGEGGTPRLRLAADADLARAATPEAAAREAIRHLMTLFPVQRAGVLLFDEADEEGVRVLASHPESEDEPFCDPAGKLRTDGRSGAIVSLPLVQMGDQIGVLSFTLSEPDTFTSALREECDALAAGLADAIGRPLSAELRQRVTKLERENARLMELNDELETFAHSVSHDLLSPVRTIQAAAEALQQAAGPTAREDILRHAAHVKETTGRLARLVDDLLAYSRLGRLQERVLPIDLHEVVEEALTQLGTEVGHAGADVQVSRVLPRVLGHHATLVQAVMNLLSNAIKFVRPGVRPSVWIGSREHDGWGRLIVRDNGIGIAQDQLVRVFRIFERLHGAEAYPGSGLGLAIVQRGMTKMGGRVGVESTRGAGSTFWLELPLAR